MSPLSHPDHPSRQPVTGKATFQARRGGAERPETGEAKGGVWRWVKCHRGRRLLYEMDPVQRPMHHDMS